MCLTFLVFLGASLCPCPKDRIMSFGVGAVVSVCIYN